AEKRYQYNLGYVIQEWAEDAWKKGGLQPAKNILAKMLKKYPAVPEVKQVVVGFVGRVLESLAASKAYEQQALAVIEAFGPLLEKKGEVRDLIRYVYDSLAEKYKQRQQWEQAVGVYQKALALYPQDEHLRHNTAVAWDGWISMFVRRGRWEEALKVCEKASGQKLEEQHFLEKTGYVVQEYAEVICRQQGSEKAEALLERMLAKYPDNSHVQQAAGGYFQRRLQEIKHDPRHEQKAAAIMARSQKILSDQQTVQKLDKNRYDEMAGVYLAGKKWQDAIAVYKTALKHYPEDKHVLNNAIAVWDAWNNDCVARKDWEQALTVCEQAAQQPLDPNHFTNNQLFTMQEYLKDAFAAGGLTKSAGVLSNLLRRFYSLAGVQEMALGHFQYVLSSLNSRDPKTCENEGRKVILKGKGILKDEQAAKKLAYVLYDRLAQEAGSRGQWEEAVALYNRALQQYPADAHLLGNLAVSWNQWAQTYISRQEWKKAIGVYEKALKAVPGNSMLQNNLEYCKEKSKL
ncbi:tetratricopeptide repeat protein, partial [candidate division FCPU426 bacterium]|nr:tetratricopeptide repeat protein [candidate division FCPU426 bacterium]